MTPILAVDVDGVLNRMSRTALEPGERLAQVTVPQGTFPIRYRPAMGVKLALLATETGAELTWCTTWEQLANTHISPLLGFPELPWVPMAPGRVGLRFGDDRPVGEIKARALAVYAAGRPWAWFDDDAEPFDLTAARPWSPGSLFRVDDRVGLTDEHLAKARDYLMSLKEETTT